MKIDPFEEFQNRIIPQNDPDLQAKVREEKEKIPLTYTKEFFQGIHKPRLIKKTWVEYIKAHRKLNQLRVTTSFKLNMPIKEYIELHRICRRYGFDSINQLALYFLLLVATEEKYDRTDPLLGEGGTEETFSVIQKRYR